MTAAAAPKAAPISNAALLDALRRVLVDGSTTAAGAQVVNQLPVLCLTEADKCRSLPGTLGDDDLSELWETVDNHLRSGDLEQIPAVAVVTVRRIYAR